MTAAKKRKSPRIELYQLLKLLESDVTAVRVHLPMEVTDVAAARYAMGLMKRTAEGMLKDIERAEQLAKELEQ